MQENFKKLVKNLKACKKISDMEKLIDVQEMPPNIVWCLYISMGKEDALNDVNSVKTGIMDGLLVFAKAKKWGMTRDFFFTGWTSIDDEEQEKKTNKRKAEDQAEKPSASKKTPAGRSGRK